MVDINYFCRIYDDFLSSDDCKNYITKFEENLKKIDVLEQYDDPVLVCGEDFQDLNFHTIDLFREAIYRYKCDIGEDQSPSYFPGGYGWEQIKIKKFRVNSNKSLDSELHTEVGSLEEAKRFLSLTIYLNDDFNEGEKYFPLFNTKVKPKKGSLFIAPPFWNFLQKEIPPKPPSISGAKYCLTTYLHFVKPPEANNKVSDEGRALSDDLTKGRGGHGVVFKGNL